MEKIYKNNLNLHFIYFLIQFIWWLFFRLTSLELVFDDDRPKLYGQFCNTVRATAFPALETLSLQGARIDTTVLIFAIFFLFCVSVHPVKYR
jgi:uncharacterized membrane protein